MSNIKTQPQATDLEEAVIGSLLQDREALSKVASIIDSDSFYDKRHGLIFDAIEALSGENKPIDILTVKDRLEKDGLLDAAGGAYYIMKLSSQVASAAHIEYHSLIIQQKAKARSFITNLSTLVDKSYDPSVDIDEVLEEAEMALFDITSNGVQHDFINAREVAQEVYDEINKAASADGEPTGIVSGLDALDRITGGFQSPDLIVIAARPAMGKTALALSIAKHTALDHKIPTGLFSLEMDNIQIVKRATSIMGSISSHKLRDGSLNDIDWQSLDHGMSKIINGELWLDDTPSLSLMEFKSKVRRMVKDCGVKLIMIDYLQLMTAKVRGGRQEEVSTISRGLKATAKELGIPIIALSQLNREVESRDGASGKRPQLSDLRESGAIEQDADLVIAIHRPEYYGVMQDDKGMDMKGIAELLILKHRNGATGEVMVSFKGEFTRFENINDTIPAPSVPF